MKYLKMLGLAAAAAGVLMAFAGTGTASAAVMCTVNKTPCPKADTVLFVYETLVGSVALTTTGGTTVATCTGGELETSEATQGAGKPITAPISTLSWSSCTGTTDTSKTGSLEISQISGGSNGTVIAKGLEITTSIGGSNCSYGVGTGTDLGTLAAGGEEATMTVSTTLARTAGGFLCPSSVSWNGKWKITNHKVIYVVSEGE